MEQKSKKTVVKPKLKKCPFCGGKAKLIDERILWVVRCVNSKCSATIIGDCSPEPNGEEPIGYWKKFEQSAIERWNKRTNCWND
jgi:hypothetical protein